MRRCNMAETVEAVQCYLEGVGWVLWPTPTGRPAPRITDYEVQDLKPRIFEKPNAKGQKFWYKRNPSMYCWDVTYEEAPFS